MGYLIIATIVALGFIGYGICTIKLKSKNLKKNIQPLVFIAVGIISLKFIILKAYMLGFMLYFSVFCSC